MNENALRNKHSGVVASLAPVLLSAPRVPTPCPRSTATLTYRRRQPEQTALHEAVRTQLLPFLASHEVPAFVARAFRKFVSCGLLAGGFVRVRCGACASEMLVAFSCKDRGFCPSCTARRAAETAAHLVDNVLPHVAMRQFVLALPFELHRRVARECVASPL